MNQDTPPLDKDEALRNLGRHWHFNGDTASCTLCKRSLVASREGEQVPHRAGCRNKDQQHPWGALRAILAS